MLNSLCFFLGWWGYKNYAGAFSAVYLPKANSFQPNRTSFDQMRDFYAKIRPHLREIVVIGFTENVKNVGRNNAIYHFDT